jgi:hypothetical protein
MEQEGQKAEKKKDWIMEYFGTEMVGTGRVGIEKPGQERKGCEHGLGKQ